jgi:hypothetical protein
MYGTVTATEFRCHSNDIAVKQKTGFIYRIILNDCSPSRRKN